MAHRASTRKRTDRKIFKNTASKTKKMNIMPKVARGGIRL